MTDPTPKPKPPRPPRTLTEMFGTEQDARAEAWGRIAKANPAWSQAEVDAAEEREFQRGRARNLSASRRGRRGRAGFMSQMAQGATFGFSDEIMGLGDAVEDKIFRGDKRPFREVYEDRRDAERERQHEFTDRRPGTALIAQLAGGFLTGGGLLRSATKAAPTLAAQTGRGIATGAAAGAVGGAGASEAATTDGIVTDAVEGGLLGGLVGGAAPSLIAGAGKLVAPVARGVRGAARRIAEGGAPAADEAIPTPTATDEPRRLLNRGGGAAPPPPRGAPPTAGAAPVPTRPSGPTPTLIQRLAARVAGPKSEAVADAVPDRSLLRIGKALRDDNIELDDFATRGAGATSPARASERIADLGGDQTRRLVRGSEAVPSAGASRIRETLRERQAAQGNRVAQVIARAFGMDEAPDLVMAAKYLQGARRAASRPAYERAYGPPDAPNTVPRDLLAPYLDEPEFRAALREGMRQVSLDRKTGDLLVDGPFLREAVTDVLEDGTPVVELMEQVPVQIVDYVKRGLDAVIERGVKGNSMDKARVRSLKTLRDQLLDSVDDAVPEYRAARRIYQGGSEDIGALEAGQQAMRRSVTRDAMRNELESLSDEAAEQYRLGALGALLEDAANVADGRDVLATIQRNPAMRDKLMLLVPDGDGRRMLQELLESEGRQTQTRRVIEGSRTAALQEDIASLDDGSPVTALRDAARQGNVTLTGVAARAGDAIVDRLMRQRRNAIADELGPLLMQPATRAEQLARRISAAEQRAARRAQAAQRGAGGAATGAGQQTRNRQP